MYVSAASAWEIATKHRLGELEGAAPVVTSDAALAGFPAIRTVW